MTALDRALRIAGTIPLLGLAAVAVWTVLVIAVAPVTDNGTPREANDLAGCIELYDEDALVLSTTTAGLRRVQIDARTLVREPNRAGNVTALLPGRLVTVWLRGASARDVARTIVVWGASQ